MQQGHIFSVQQLTRYLRELISSDNTLRDLWVRGEVSNCTRAASGHVYFTLKDEHSQLECALFREDANRQTFLPQDGLKVIARGSLTVYERRGRYQLVVSELQADGVGALYLAFEQLKKKLEAEGLFRPDRKRPIPAFPSRVAIITSTDGAVLHDFVTTTRRRWPPLAILVVPSLVSGEGAVEALVRSLALAGKQAVDVVVLARGGGSLEELWAFNTEPVARAIAGCPIPTISAVGHETDYTIADFVADLREPTPTAAAMKVAPDRREVQARLTHCAARAAQALKRRLAMAQRELELLRSRRVLTSPQAIITERAQRIDELWTAAQQEVRRLVENRRERVASIQGRLLALSPTAILRRGYAVMRRKPDGKVVRSISQVKAKDAADVILHDGTAECRVERTQPAPAGRG